MVSLSSFFYLLLLQQIFQVIIARDSRFDDMPLILETPDESRWAEEIAELKRFSEE